MAKLNASVIKQMVFIHLVFLLPDDDHHGNYRRYMCWSHLLWVIEHLTHTLTDYRLALNKKWCCLQKYELVSVFNVRSCALCSQCISSTELLFRDGHANWVCTNISHFLSSLTSSSSSPMPFLRTPIHPLWCAPMLSLISSAPHGKLMSRQDRTEHVDRNLVFDLTGSTAVV